MYLMRRIATRTARSLELIYLAFDSVILAFAPVLKLCGFERLERPAAWFESWSKGALFDCRMCGRCVLSKTGMTCPMNCPKQLRNGPCGGVRQNGNCEVAAEMKCVWIDAWAGAGRMRRGGRLATLMAPLDHRLKGSSAWLRRLAERAGEGGAAR